LGCVCIGLLGLVWGEAQPLDYIIVILVLKSIEQPILPHLTVTNFFDNSFCLFNI
jgi:hypothetical protein